MQLNDATRIIDVIDQRIAKHTASNARVETTWGTVAAVSADGRYADLYLYGQSAPYTSDYFRLPNGLSVNVGNSVKAAIDKERGDRWIEEVHTFPAYNKVEFDIEDGVIRFGSGTGATDTDLYRGAANQLKTTNDFVVGRTLYVRTGTNSGDAIYVGNDSKLVDVDVADRIGIQGQQNAANGGVVFGSAKDTNLYRSAADVLKTDDTFEAAFLQVGSSAYRLAQSNGLLGLLNVSAALGLRARSILLSTSYADPDPLDAGIQFGADTNLYRAGADILKTDDRFDSANFFRSERAAVNSTHFQGAIAGDSAPRLDIITDSSGRPAIRFGSGSGAADATLYRSGAAALSVTGGLSVSGTMSWGSLAAAHKRWRYVPLATMSTVLNGAAGATATVVELTAIPANTAIAAEVTIGVRESAGNNVNIQVYHYNGGVQGASAAITYTSGVAARGGFSSAGPVLVGGTNGRQIVWATSATGAAVSAYLYVHGYWVLED